MRAERLGRVGEKFAAAFAALGSELVLAQVCPEGLGFQLFEKRPYFPDSPSPFILGFAHSAPRISVACMHRLPPWPLTMPALAFFTWRAGSTSLPRNCLAASVTWSMPSMWACDSKPPCVFTGNAP